MTQSNKDDEKDEKAQGSLLDGLFAQGRAMLGGMQDQAEEQLKQQQERAGDLASSVVSR